MWGVHTRTGLEKGLVGACTHVQVSVLGVHTRTGVCGGQGARCAEFTVPLTVEGCEFSQEENEEKDYFARCLDSRIR